MLEYVFKFSAGGDVTRIPHAKWSRIREGNEALEEYASNSIRIAYAYLSLDARTCGAD